MANFNKKLGLLMDYEKFFDAMKEEVQAWQIHRKHSNLGASAGGGGKGKPAD